MIVQKCERRICQLYFPVTHIEFPCRVNSRYSHFEWAMSLVKLIRGQYDEECAEVETYRQKQVSFSASLTPIG